MKRVPKYRRHKASGQAVVVLDKVWHYLGAYGSEASKRKYERLVAAWLANGRRRLVEPHPELIVASVLNAYLAYAKGVVGGSQLDRITRAVGRAIGLHGETPAAEFGGRALKGVRAKFVESGYNRRHVNQLTGCLKKAWKWALSEELVPAESAQSVLAVAGLREGETAAPEPVPVAAVDLAVVEATLPFLPPAVADMVRVQLASGVRPDEVCRMRADEMSEVGDDLWVWRPSSHKTAHHGHGRQAYLGPRTIAVIRPRLEASQGGYLFSPAREREARFAAMRAARKSRVQPSQEDRKKDHPRKAPGERYLRTSYCHAVAKGCKRAGVPHWHPHQLRHAAATLLKERYGWEVARVYLGHRSLDVTKIYAEDDLRKAAAAAREVG